MFIRALRLRHFRNLSEVMITPNERFNIFTGANGQGKTNLLESLYLLSAVKSFRPQTNADLIEFGEKQALLEARVDRGGYERIVKIEVGDRGKKIFLNNNPVRNLSDFFGTLNVVMFGPEDISLMKGSPSRRRDFIDRAIFNAHPGFGTDAMHYEEILKQRNALLKQPKVDAILLSTYDEQLIQYGAAIINRRLNYMREFVPVLEQTFKTIFDDSFEVHLSYDLTWSKEPVANPLEDLEDTIEIERLLAEALDARAQDERDRGHTLVGPHRDDLKATLNGKEVKSFASQGQHRALVLAMKCAEITYLEERFRFAPILLLDDVSSELDQARNRFLFDFLHDRMEGQVFITTTHRDYILLDQDVSVWHVTDGELEGVEGVVDSVEDATFPDQDAADEAEVIAASILEGVESPVDSVSNLAGEEE